MGVELCRRRFSIYGKIWFYSSKITYINRFPNIEIFLVSTPLAHCVLFSYGDGAGIYWIIFCSGFLLAVCMSDICL